MTADSTVAVVHLVTPYVAPTFVVNPVFNFTIPWWPVVIFLAIAWSLFLPDRYRDGGIGRVDTDRFVTRGIGLILWLFALLWFIPGYMSTPGAADFDTSSASLVQGTQGYWPAVGYVFGAEYGWLRHGGWVPLLLAAYVVLGVVWAIVYFWIYARRLSYLYVLKRDAWMVEHGVTGLVDLTAEQTRKFNTVIAAVQGEMLYRGAFPLKAGQQKRFFVANVTLWPLTLVCWLVGDFVLDVARGIWFALRGWIHRQWVKGMAQYLADEAVCKAYIEELKAAGPATNRSVVGRGALAAKAGFARARQALRDTPDADNGDN
jgi:hypothetical protein